jgi:hypothetical protein
MVVTVNNYCSSFILGAKHGPWSPRDKFKGALTLKMLHGQRWLKVAITLTYYTRGKRFLIMQAFLPLANN